MVVDIKLPVLQPTAIRPTTNFNSMLPQLFQCVVYHEHNDTYIPTPSVSTAYLKFWTICLCQPDKASALLLLAIIPCTKRVQPCNAFIIAVMAWSIWNEAIFKKTTFYNFQFCLLSKMNVEMSLKYQYPAQRIYKK